MTLRSILHFAVGTLLLMTGHVAFATMLCSVAASPATLTGIYSSLTNLDVLGAITISCTRDPASDVRKPTIWIGISQSSSGGTMTRDIGGSTLTYSLSRTGYANGLWTDAGNQGVGQSGTGGIQDRIDFGNGGATYNAPYSLYMRVPLGQATAAAGVYLDALTITMRLNSDTGAVLATNTVSLRVSIPRNCRFSSNPSPIAVNYPAFSPTPVTATTTFALTCTQGTTFSLSLDLTRGRIPTVLLAYDISLSAATSTGTAVAQTFNANVSLDAGQAGSCPGSGVCTGNDVRTITVTY